MGRYVSNYVTRIRRKMATTDFPTLVQAFLEDSGDKIVVQNDDLVSLSLEVSYGAEKIYIERLHSLLGDDFGIQIFSEGLSLPNDSFVLNGLAHDFLRRNDTTLGVFWGFVMGPDGTHALRVFSKFKARDLNQRRCRSAIAAILAECEYLHMFFFAANGGLVITPLKANPKWRK
jgi:hypothetical protein